MTVLPVLPAGYVFLVDEQGNYLESESAQYLITPAPFLNTDGRTLFANIEPPPLSATHVLVNQNAALFLPLGIDVTGRWTPLQLASQTITLVFTKPDGSSYEINSFPVHPAIYLAKVQSDLYFVYGASDNQFDQPGRWQVCYSIGFDYVSASYMFFIYPP